MYQQRRFSRRPRQPRQFDPSFLIQRTKGQVKLDVVPITHEFADFAIEPALKLNIQTKGYLVPTPIQDQVIPHILDSKDVVGIANTGTGKTAALFNSPHQQSLKNPQEKVLIVTPTRELASQIEAEFMALSGNLRLSSALCIGGAAMGRQIQRLRQNPAFVIGTPGRLKDLLQRRILNLNNFANIVLDEVDRMLDMGFIHDVQHLISFLPAKRQSLFFSATIEGKVREVMTGFLKTR